MKNFFHPGLWIVLFLLLFLFSGPSVMTCQAQAVSQNPAKAQKKAEPEPDPEACMAEGDFGTAVQVLTRRLEKSPNDAALLALLGDAYFSIGNEQVANPDLGGDPGSSFADAELYYQKAIKLSPALRVAGLGLAKARYLLNDLAGAREAIESLVSAYSEDAEIRLWAGQIFQSLAQESAEGESPTLHQAAVDHLEKALALEPGQDRVMLRLGNGYLFLGEMNRAKEVFMQGIETAPLAADLHESLLRFFNLEGGMAGEEGIAFYDGLLAKGKSAWTGEQEAMLWWYKGMWCDYQGGDRYRKLEFEPSLQAFEEHVDCLRAAAKAFPDFAENAQAWIITALTNCGWCHMRLKQFDEAEKAVFSALRTSADLGMDPGENQSLVLAVDSLGYEIVSNLGSEAARDFFKRLTACWDKRHQWWSDYGFFTLDVNVRTDPPGSETGKYTGPKEKYEELYRIYTKALELLPDYPRYLNDSAMVIDYYLDPEGERSDEVETLYIKAWKKGKEMYESPLVGQDEKEVMFSAFTDALVNLTRLYISRGKVEESQSALQALIEASPERPELIELRMRLQRLLAGEEETAEDPAVEETAEEEPVSE